MEELGSGVVAGDVHVAVGVGDQSAGERREVRESLREAEFEEGEKGFDGERWKIEEHTLLDVVNGEHREV